MKIALAIAVIVLPLGHLSAKEIVSKTWGKNGVSYEQYRTDAVDCAYVGYYRDISKDDPAIRFIAGWRAGDTALNMPGGNGDGWGSAIARTQPDRRKAEIHNLQISDVEACLIKRGYQEINLSRLEMKRLGKLRRGSEARRLYLYSLATR